MPDQPARAGRRRHQAFSAALKAALRQDPDVILVGEMRDLETISTALTADQDHVGVLAQGGFQGRGRS